VDPEKAVVDLDQRAARGRVGLEQACGQFAEREFGPRIEQRVPGRAGSEQLLSRRVRVVDPQTRIDEDDGLGKLGQNSLGNVDPLSRRCLG
jgi:hypothetical protein